MKKLTVGITVDTLKAAFGTSNPPDLAPAANNLRITESVLMNALGIQLKP
ncbi:unannotated protein [freshwater metagenome]|uniref:Unannotated protein n=1 Tax=freshwater metagenome TaxID=449393 RepID=A0A6J7ENL1_9ZZZZ|nr:hypothetical protein [Actinomycetota bacterium]